MHSPCSTSENINTEARCCCVVLGVCCSSDVGVAEGCGRCVGCEEERRTAQVKSCD